MNDPRALSMMESTPNVSSLNFSTLKSGNVLLHSFVPSPIVPIHSSTLNDSLVDSVEQWNLKITPSTSPLVFYQNHQKSLQKTPVKTATTSKLGSPERNEIINGRKPTVGKWTLTPKLERSSPAKKRLFGLHHISNGAVQRATSLLAAHTKQDPVLYFMKRRNIPSVVKRIFSDLKDNDLYNCRRVSRTWRNAVDSFPKLQRAARGHALKEISNKENPWKLSLSNAKSDDSPMEWISDKFIQLGQTLKENQHLTKCLHCGNPQVVEYNIGQCLTCGYICCFKCKSESHEGPEQFVDACQRSKLLLPAKSGKRRTLMDSPPYNAQLSFLSTSSLLASPSADNSHLYANITHGNSKDSCYYSNEDMSSMVPTPDTSLSALAVLNGQRTSSTKRGGSSLNSSLSDEERAKRPARSSNTYMPVLQLRKSPEKVLVEDSPAKDNRMYKGVGTVASKKRLRRLLR